MLRSVRRLALAAVIGVAATFLPATASTGTPPPDQPGWDSVAALNDEGDLVLFGWHGAEVSRQPSASGDQVMFFPVPSDRLVVNDWGTGTVTVLDPAFGEQAQFAVPAQWPIQRAQGSSSVLYAIPPDALDDGVVINLQALAGIDLSELDATAPEPMFQAGLFFATVDGSRVAVPELSELSSIVVSFDDTDPVVATGIPVGFAAERLVTRGLTEAGQSIYYHDVPGGGRQPTEIPVGDVIRAIVLADGSTVTVDRDGTIGRIAPGANEQPTIGAVEPEGFDESSLGDVAPFGSADNAGFLVSTATEVTFYSAGGDALETLSIADGRHQPLPSDPASRCVVVHSTSSGPVVVFDTEDREVVAEVEGDFITAASADGCTVAVPGEEGVTVIAGIGPGDGWEFQEPDSRLGALSPDGAVAVVVDAAGQAHLIDLATADPADPTAGSVHLGEPAERFFEFAFVDRQDQ